MEDRYEARLREVIEAKIRGEGVTPKPEPEVDSNVVDLMAALKRSLGELLEKQAPAKAKKATPARKRA